MQFLGAGRGMDGEDMKPEWQSWVMGPRGLIILLSDVHNKILKNTQFYTPLSKMPVECTAGSQRNNSC